VSAPTPRLAGLRFAVEDLERAKGTLRRNDVSWTASGATVLVAPERACGTLIVFS
jgi:hypothetical protein